MKSEKPSLLSSISASLVTKILFLFVVVFAAVSWLLPSVQTQFKSNMTSAYEKRSIEEQLYLFENVVKVYEESLVSYLRPWLYGENLEPLFEEPVDSEVWQDNLFTLGNQLSVKFDTEYMFTFDTNGNLVGQNQTKDSLTQLTPSSEKGLSELVELGIEETAIQFEVLNLSSGRMVSALVIPSDDEDGDTSHVHLFLGNAAALVRDFSKASGYTSFLQSGKEVAPIQGAESYQKQSNGDYTNTLEPDKVFLRRTIDLGANFLGGGAELLVYVNQAAVRSMEKKLDENLRNVMIGLIGGGLPLAMLLLVLMLRPLSKMTKVASQAASGAYNVRVNYESASEVGMLGAAFDHMLQNIENSAIERKEFISKLDKENREITTLFNRLEEGIFSFGSDLKIKPRYSSYLHQLLGEKESLSNQDFYRLILNNTDLNADRMSQVKTCLDECLGQDILSYEANDHLLVKECMLTDKSGAKKVLEMGWCPLTNDLDEVEEMMVVIRDVTEIRELELQARKQAEELQLLGEMLQIKPASCLAFFEFATAEVKRCQAHANLESGFGSFKSEIMGALHTIKGNSRSLGFSKVALSAHTCEESFKSSPKSPNDNPEWSRIQRAFCETLHALAADLKTYKSLWDEKLGALVSADNGGLNLPLVSYLKDKNPSDLESIFVELENHKESKLNELGFFAHSVYFEEVATQLSRSFSQLVSERAQLNAQFNCATEGLCVTSGEIAQIEGVLNHVLRNSVAHSLPNQPEHFRTLEASVELVRASPDTVYLTYSDNGKGVNLEELKAAQGSNLSTDETLEKLFDSGFSSNEEADELSGRGEGLYAVRQLLRELGGDCKLYLGQKTPEGGRTLVHEMTISTKHCRLLTDHTENLKKAS